MPPSPIHSYDSANSMINYVNHGKRPSRDALGKHTYYELSYYAVFSIAMVCLFEEYL